MASSVYEVVHVACQSRIKSTTNANYNYEKPCTEKETSAHTWGILYQKRSLDLFFYFNKVTFSFFNCVV